MQEDEAFIRRLVARDPLACRQLVKQHHGRLVAVARPLVGQAAEDVVQDAWLQAFRALPKFEGRSTLNTWLTRIVLNAAYSHHRYDRSRLMQSLDAVLEEGMPMLERFDRWGHWNDPLAVWTADTPEDILGREQLARRLQQKAQELPDAQRLAWLLRDQSGLEFAEIAESLGTTQANVRVLLHRARLRLMEVINQFEEGVSC